MARKKVHAVLSAGCVVFQAGVPVIAFAQGHELDLSSQNKNITAGSEFHDLSISVDNGAGQKTFSSGDLLTAAEFVALTQVLGGGAMAQTLNVASNGAALGGTFNLSTFAANSASIHIPQGVIGVSDAAMGAINLSGNLSNSGTLYAISSNSNITSAVFSANNILNNQGALFSSLLPSGGLAGYTSAVANLSLSLNAIQDIINAGTISSAGALNLTAGGSIINALPAGAAGVQPIMQALGTITMISSQLTNAGLVNSLAGNINVNSVMAQPILVNNVGGTLSALNGALNVRDASFDTGKFNLDIVGGDVLAKELNLFSGNGKIDINVNELEGKINVVSHELAVAANTPVIRMGNVIVTGDPIITNANGDVIIEPDNGEAFLTHGGPLIVTAGRNIISTAGIIDTEGGVITMTAGGVINLTATSLLNSKSANGLGGHITLNAVGGIFLNETGTVSSGGYIKMDTPGNISAGNLVTGGNNGVILTAGGTIATGNINATGIVGGGVQIRAQQSGGAAAFVVGVTDTRNANGINGTVNTSGSGGRSGLMYLNNGPSGDIVIDPAFLNMRGVGQGGDLAIDAGSGTVSFNAGTLNLSGNGSAPSGNLFVTANQLALDNTHIILNGANGGTFASSTTNFNANGDVSITTNGNTSGGTIQLMSGDSLSVTANFDPSNGFQNLSVSGDVNYATGLTVNSTGSLQLTSNAGFGGGSIRLMGGDVALNGGDMQMTANGTSNGNGGLVVFDTATFSNNASVSMSANGSDNGSGGFLSIITFDGSSDVAIGDDLSLSATGGENGRGGVIYMSITGGLTVAEGATVTSAAGAEGLFGGSIELYAGTNGSGDVSINGTLNASGGTGGGGFVSIASTNGNVHLGSESSIIADSEAGWGGAIYVTAGADLQANGLISANTADAAAGTISLEAGLAGLGSMTINGDITSNASATGQGGEIYLGYNSASQLIINGSVQANGTDGPAGSVNLSHNGDGNLNVLLNGSLSATNAHGTLGAVNANQTDRDVSIQGTGSASAEFNLRGASVDISLSGSNGTLTVGDIGSTSGNISLHQTGSGSTLRITEGSFVSALGGNISLGAENIILSSESHLQMDSAGLLSMDSGSVSGSMTLTLSGRSYIEMTGGSGDLRPGAVTISPRNGGNLTITGTGALEVTGATVSASTTTGNLIMDSEASISSDAFDELLGVGIEFIAGSGNISLNGGVDTSNLALATLQGGSIVLGTDITSPTVSISTTGSGSIQQTGGTIGIGSLILASGTGDIGTAESGLNTNVLELKVTSGGSVFLSNDSDVDIKTSQVAGLFQLNNNGDVSMESTVQAENIALTSTGSISIFESANGASGITLNAGESSITVNGAGSLSSGGDIILSTSQLQLDGDIASSGGAIRINSSGALTLNGEGTLSSSSGGIEINASSIDVQTSLALNAGGGTATMQAGSIVLGSAGQATLSVAGNSTLALTTSSLTIANGSKINVDKQSGAAIRVSSAAGLNVSLSASAGAQLTTGGGSISFQSGVGGNLVFDNGGQLFNTNLNVSGGTLSTTSTSADTQFNGVNVVSDSDVFVNVHDGTLAMGGDITSSNTDGQIALLDPDGMVIAGNGNVAFVNGGWGTITIAATGAGNDLVLTGTHTLDSGVGGSIKMSSDSGIVFGANSQLTMLTGATSIAASSIEFQNNAQLTTAGTVALSGQGLTVTTPGGGTATIAAAGGVTLSSTPGSQLTFATSTPGTDGVLAFTGGPVGISASNANVVVEANTVLTSDNNITISTPGGTLINNGLIQTPNQDDTITVEASGNLLVDRNISATNIVVRTISNNGNITLASDLAAVERLLVSAHGSGNILQTGGSLSAGEIVLESGSGNIGSKNDAIQFTSSNVRVSTTGSVWLAANGSTQIDSAQAGKQLSISSSGNLTVGASANVSASKVELTSAKQMVVNGTVTGASSVTLKTENGSLSGTGTVGGGDVKLQVHNGNIGSAANALKTAAGELTVQITKAGAAWISELDAVSLNKVQVVDGFSITSGGNLTVDDVRTKEGNISLVSLGSVQLVKNSRVNTDEGNILIQSKDTTNGTIRIGENSKVEAYASSAPNGTVTIVVGEVPSSWVKGNAPSNVSVSSKWGGQVYFGSKGITALGKKNEINAWGSNVYFSTGNRSASAIVLEGNVRITADPPPALSMPGNAALSMAPNSVPVAKVNPAIVRPVPPSTVMPAALNRTSFPLRGEVSETVDSADDEQHVAPVGAYSRAPGMSPIAKQVAFLRNADIRQSANTRTSIKENGDLCLEQGQLIVQARKPMSICAGDDAVQLSPGAVVLITKTADSLEVFNLYERGASAVTVQARGHKPVAVGAGKSLAIGDLSIASNVASRKHVATDLTDGRTLHTAEYSMLSLASRAEVVSNLLHSQERNSRQLVDRLLKMAAALNVVTQSHGPFKK